MQNIFFSFSMLKLCESLSYALVMQSFTGNGEFLYMYEWNIKGFPYYFIKWLVWHFKPDIDFQLFSWMVSVLFQKQIMSQGNPFSLIFMSGHTSSKYNYWCSRTQNSMLKCTKYSMAKLANGQTLPIPFN